MNSEQNPQEPAADGPAVVVSDCPITLADGETFTLGDRYAGRPLLIVNVASECGFTPQYAGLQRLHERFAGEGLQVLGVPCNQFGGQEPGSDAEIGAFCSTTFGVTFPLAAKTEVNGPGAHPLFERLTSFPTGERVDVAWNFEKFVVDRAGRVVARFDSKTEPESDGVIAAIREVLA